MPPSARSARAPAEGSRPSVRAFVLRFTLTFAVLEALVLLVLWQARWFEPYAAWNAALTAAGLRPFLEGIASSGSVLMLPGFSISIRPGCDAYQAIAVLMAGVLAFPAPTARKWLGAIVGTLVLLALNLVRLGALLWTGARHPAHFELMHLEVLPALYVAAALGLLLSWILWARR